MTETFKFTPVNYSWVAIHPNPIGVVRFIGGAFFGTFPTIFYRSLLRHIFEQKYTIIALPYRFTFHHWSVAIGLVREQGILLKTIRAEAKRLGYAYQIYEQDPLSEQGNYYWVAHSLGNKYVALLELLSELEEKRVRDILGGCAEEAQAREIEVALRGVDLHDISLKNQPSVLMAPAITGIESAIPVRFIAKLFKRLGLDVKPNVDQTHCLIKRSLLFNLIGLIAFNDDAIARPTIRWMQTHLPHQAKSYTPLPGKHLTPLGFRSGNRLLADQVTKFLQALQDLC